MVTVSVMATIGATSGRSEGSATRSATLAAPAAPDSAATSARTPSKAMYTARTRPVALATANDARTAPSAVSHDSSCARLSPSGQGSALFETEQETRCRERGDEHEQRPG